MSNMVQRCVHLSIKNVASAKIKDRKVFWKKGKAKKPSPPSNFVSETWNEKAILLMHNRDLSEYVTSYGSFDESFNYHKQLLKNYRNII